MRANTRRQLWRALWAGGLFAWFALVPAFLGYLAGLSVDRHLGTSPRYATALGVLGLLLGSMAAFSLLRRRTRGD